MNNPITEAVASILLGCLFPLIVIAFCLCVIVEVGYGAVDNCRSFCYDHRHVDARRA